MNITTELQQAAALILKAKNIVLMPHAKMDCDGMSASIALFLLLKKLGKNPTAVCSDPVPESFAFLPSSEVFTETMPLGNLSEKKFVVTVNTKEKGFKDLQYTVEDGKVNILMFSENSPFEESDFSFLGTEMAPDLIITLDSGDTKQLGNMYTDNFDLFESVPVINIDHHVSNTQFGDVNVVDFKSCSTTELIYRLSHILSPKSNILDANIATLLLAGMLTDTGSFQHSNTTPASLDIAAELIEIGARHQDIVKHLFKTKSLATLRVWGRVLTKLQNDPIYRIVWSSVSKNDLEETQAHSDETNGLIDELMATTPGTELVLLVKEREDNIISTSVRSSGPEVDSVAFTAVFGGGGHKQAAGFKIRERGGKSFDEIVSDIVFEAKKFQSKRLHVPMPKRDLISTLTLDPSFTPIEKEETQNVEKISELENLPALPNFENSVTSDTAKILENNELSDDREKEISSVEPLHNKNISIIQDNEKNEDILKETSVVEESQTEEKIFDKNLLEAVKEEIKQESEPQESFLSPEEQSYLNAPEYKISEPEIEIEKHEEGEYIDDLADFLSKGENDHYLTEEDTSTISHESKNNENKIIENLSDVSNLPNIPLEHTASEFLNSQGETFEPLPQAANFVPQEIFQQPESINQLPPVQNIPNTQNVPQQAFSQNNQFQPPPAEQFIPPQQNIQQVQNDPFLQSLKS